MLRQDIAKTVAQNRRQLKATESNGEQRKRREAESRRRRLAAVRLAEKAAEEENTGVNRKWL